MKPKILAVLPLLVLLPCFIQAQNAHAQAVASFEGLEALELGSPGLEIDANGAVGTKQYMEWVNTYYQAYSKTSPYTAVWPTPQNGDTPWQENNQPNCYGTGGGEGTVTFDRIASQWVIARRASPAANNYYYCVAISSTADLTSASLKWYTYVFNLTPFLGLNTRGDVYYPDWPRFATWADGYYATFDLEDPDNSYQEIGVVACALDRTNMIKNGTARAMQCFSNPSPIPTNGALYLGHSLIPADIDNTTAPPSGRHEFMASIQNPTANGTAATSTELNLWTFSVNWTTPSLSTFTKSSLTVASYEPGCYDVLQPANTFCVTEPSSSTTGNYVDSVGDRLMPRMPYHNFGTYESFLVSHTVQVGSGSNQQTGIRWYELRGSGTPTIFQSGTVTNGSTLYRFVPSIAQDKVGNAAVGYSVSSSGVHPGIRAAYWNLPGKTAPSEIALQNGTGDEENSNHWGNITSMTVDPNDGCTFWYENQYYKANETGTSINWDTRVSNFKLSSCH